MQPKSDNEVGYTQDNRKLPKVYRGPQIHGEPREKLQ